MKQKLEKWQRWFSIIYDETLTVAAYRQVFFELRQMVEVNPNLQRPSLYYAFASDTYATYCLAAIRRQVDLDSDAVSLLRLLNELEKNPIVLTREWYVEAFLASAAKQVQIDAMWAKRAHTAFDGFAGSDGNVLSVEPLATDSEVLKAAAATCRAYVDRRIAHRDQRAPTLIPNLADAHHAVDTVGGLIKKYHLLFRFSELHDFTPILPLDWKEIFRTPWIPDPGGMSASPTTIRPE